MDAFRELSTTGISPEEYRTAVRIPELICRKLEAATNATR
ncbi:hypothetical protein BX266_7029 [Streptomyces sp. TLI_171]|nr:hypothetical protein BX266_7029 [Streptomyces sp. TLI_171]